MAFQSYTFEFHGKKHRADLDPKNPDSLIVIDSGICWQCDGRLSETLEAGTVSGTGDQILCCNKCDTQYRLTLVPAKVEV